MVKTIIMVVYVIICIALTIIVLSQEGKSASLTSSITGGNYDNSYWGKNKGKFKRCGSQKDNNCAWYSFYNNCIAS